MTLGFSVDDLLPKARGGGQLRMGLAKLSEDEWLQPEPDLAAREAAFAAFPQGVQATPEGSQAEAELAAMLGVEGGLLECAKAHHEDMCLLTLAPGDDQYRLVGAAVAWPSDWHPKDKIGLPLRALHAPIAGYEEHLATGVDRFMETLKAGQIYGRCNWFIAPTGERRWLADAPPHEAFAHVTPDNAGETLFVRSERQTLRRLPETGAILFGIGVYVTPYGELSQANQAMLASAIENLVAGEGDRRGAPHYAEALLRYHERNPQ
ncbi:heme-dependent oxidative N-demethylase family protein [Altererythrobacter sp. GH1-8]|uniref:heme-dependent oxidative N-demethylase family protein n=1 Tax=Altererythrobacter sp. GH1-8 TaxID=3349333 RepID=UPI00374D252B